MRTRPIGSIVGAIAGLVFVLVNAGAVPVSPVWRIVAVVAFVAVMWFVVLRGPEVRQDPPSPTALRIYGLSVVAMLIAIPAGASVLNNVLDRPNAVLVWVIFVVGGHFWPFAQAFKLPVFVWLSASLVLVAIIGAIATLPSDSSTAAGWTGISAGFVLLFFSAVGPAWSRTPTTADA